MTDPPAQTENESKQPKCPICNDTGIAAGVPDFPGDTHPVTMSVCQCQARPPQTENGSKQDWPAPINGSYDVGFEEGWHKGKARAEGNCRSKIAELEATIRALQAQVSSLVERNEAMFYAVANAWSRLGDKESAAAYSVLAHAIECEQDERKSQSGQGQGQGQRQGQEEAENVQRGAAKADAGSL